jgi:transcriptional regulator GlxA family with amidase domain
VAATDGGRLDTSCGLPVHAVDLAGLRPSRHDTVVVAGGSQLPLSSALDQRPLLRWLQRAGRVARRTSSVCTGAFLLAAAGLLDGRRAATHWSACDRLARAFPLVTVDHLAIFVRDGAVWTSAGVTTGIDMALAMIDEDLGRDVADAVAARLVLYVRRPGFASQFSEALVAQAQADDGLADAIAWARAHLREVSLESLARRAGLSVRTLHRRCLQRLSTTPAKLLDRLRVESARELLVRGESTKTVADRCGFGNPVRMQRAFTRELGLGPREYRMLHAPRPA